MNTKTTETTGPRQPRPVYYEPDHDGDALDTIAAVLGLRGYKLTSDESMLADFNTPHAMVTVEGGRQYLHDGDTGAYLPDVEAFLSPADYARAIADWLDGDTKWTPSQRAGAGQAWAAHAAAIGHYTRKIQERLAELSKLSSSDNPAAYRSGSPATTAAQTARDIAEEAQRLVRALVGGES